MASIRTWLLAYRVALLIAIAVNVVLAGAYVSSRGGQTTHVRIEARGDDYTVFLDGRRALGGHFENVGTGDLELYLFDASGVSSLPGHSGIDRVRVTSIATGRMIFEDDFSGGDDDAPWVAQAGTTFQREGLLQTRDVTAIVTLPDMGWRDYIIDVKYKNTVQGGIYLSNRPDGSQVGYGFKIFHHNEHSLIHRQPPHDAELIQGGPPEVARTQMVRSMVAMVLGPYPLALALATIAVALAMAARATATRARIHVPPIPAWWGYAAASAMAVAAFNAALFIALHYSGGRPHWPDAVSYVFQANIFASGRVAAQEPPVPASFDYFYPPLATVTDGKWASIFPFGHPLLLAIGSRAGAAWVVGPVLGGASVLLLFAFARRLFDTRTAIIAAALLASSPFFLMQSSNFMSHSTSLFFLLAAMTLLAGAWRQPVVAGMAAGLCFGMVFNTRPLTALALTPAFAMLLAAPIAARDARRHGVWSAAGFAIGGLVMLAAYGAYNFGTTGDVFSSNYGSVNEAKLGFGGAHSVALGMQNDQTNMAYLLLVLDGWPQYVGLALVLLPFALGTRNRWDWFCLAAAVPVIGAQTFFAESGVMQGPRLWYEAMPFLLILAARGATRAIDVITGAASASAESARGGVGLIPAVASVAVYAGVAALVGASLYGWLLSKHAGWDAENVPATASALRNFDNTDDRISSMVDAAQLHHSLVLVNDCLHWNCYGSVFWQNDPSLDGDIVYAKNLDKSNEALFRAYGDRQVYVADYEKAYIVPWGTRVTGGAPPLAPGTPAPRADEILASLGAGGRAD